MSSDCPCYMCLRLATPTRMYILIDVLLYIYLSLFLFFIIVPCFFFFFFFFQAEDGIRDATVTGVQTCALPICKSKKRKPAWRRTKLGLPDLDHAKAAVLASLHSPESQRSYRHAIDEFVGWYCSEPRLSFNKTVVTRYRIHLEDRRLAPGTTNVRLAAVRRLADEAAEAGLPSPVLAAGSRRVKGSKRLCVSLGNCQYFGVRLYGN